MTSSRTRTTSAPARSSSQVSKPRIAPVPLLWSAALRVHEDIFIRAFIEYVNFLPNLISFIYMVNRVGRSREYNHLADSGHYWHLRTSLGYWRGLWSSLDFADQPLKDCVNFINTDIVDIWNLKDRNSVSPPYSFTGLIYSQRSASFRPRIRERCLMSSKTWRGRPPACRRGACVPRKLLKRNQIPP